MDYEEEYESMNIRIMDLRRFNYGINKLIYAKTAMVTHKYGQKKLLDIRAALEKSMKV